MGLICWMADLLDHALVFRTRWVRKEVAEMHFVAAALDLLRRGCHDLLALAARQIAPERGPVARITTIDSAPFAKPCQFL